MTLAWTHLPRLNVCRLTQNKEKKKGGLNRLPITYIPYMYSVIEKNFA
jgi:hypothetical protein